MAQILRQGLDDIDNEPAVDAYVELREIDLFTCLLYTSDAADEL